MSGITGLTVILVIAVSVYVIFNNIKLRIDCTEESLYSLSKETKEVLSKLEQPVTLKFFYSKSNAQAPLGLKTFASQVEDLLYEYKVAGKGNIILEHYDPEPDSDQEETAMTFGVQGQSLNMFGPPLYFGLVASSGGTDGTIPYIDPRSERILEYNITKLIYRVANPKKPILGIMADLPVLGDRNRFRMPGQPQPAPPWYAFSEIQKNYDIRTIPTDADQIGSAIDALIVVHPKELPSHTLYAIDQFVMRGGRLIVLLDPLCTVDTPPAMGGMPMGHDVASDIPELLAAWGVGYEKDKVVVDVQNATRVPTQQGQQETPLWLSVSRDSINQDDILTSDLEMISTPFVGSLVDNTTDDIDFTPLVTSSPSAVLVSSSAARFGGGQAINMALRNSGSIHVTAAQLTGTFKTAFPAGKPAIESDDVKDEAVKKPAPPAPLTSGQSAIVLIADVDMLHDNFAVADYGFQVIPRNSNIALFENATDLMTGASDLVGIRSRGNFNRPFDVVVNLEKEARKVWQKREDELMTKLEATQNKIQRMTAKVDENQRVILSADQKKEIDKFTAELTSTRKELRQVKKNLRKDIEKLGATIKWINVGLMPALVCIAGIGFWGFRTKRK
ncbi:hypothetical protein BVX97_05330 [bacterium E08(2017)]|nr:hypothetical protein BVX97_05330 [bacterium E08(2017)]